MKKKKYGNGKSGLNKLPTLDMYLPVNMNMPDFKMQEQQLGSFSTNKPFISGNVGAGASFSLLQAGVNNAIQGHAKRRNMNEYLSSFSPFAMYGQTPLATKSMTKKVMENPNLNNDDVSLLVSFFNKVNKSKGNKLGNGEVENNELHVSEDGKIRQYKGKTHSEGGISAIIKPNDKIFSEKLKTKEGVSFADEAKKLFKLEEKLSKSLIKRPNDIRVKNTYDRIVSDLENKEMMLLMKQELKQDESGKYKYGKKPKYSDGYNPVDWDSFKGNNNIVPFAPGYVNNLNFATFPPSQFPSVKHSTDKIPTKSMEIPINITPNFSKSPTQTLDTEYYNEPSVSKSNRPLFGQSDLNSGEMLGLAGNIGAAITPLMFAIGYKGMPNRNTFNRQAGFGQESTRIMKEGLDFIDDVGAKTRNDITLSANAASRRSQNRTRSSSVANALDSKIAASEMSAHSSLANQISSVIDQGVLRIGAEVSTDETLDAQNEYRKQIADQLDEASRMSRIAEGVSNIPKLFQSTSQNLNNKVYQTMQTDAYKQLASEIGVEAALKLLLEVSTKQS